MTVVVDAGGVSAGQLFLLVGSGERTKPNMKDMIDGQTTTTRVGSCDQKLAVVTDM